MDRDRKTRLGILGSGKGSNMLAIAEACGRGGFSMEVVLVLSDVPEAGILSLASAHGLSARFLAPGKFRTKLDEDAERAYVAALREAGVEYVVLAGFMRIVGNTLLDRFPNKILNIHPALLPSFKGVQGIQDAFEYGTKITGVTVHFVDNKMDHGPIIAQGIVKIEDTDTLESLEKKIHRLEHKLYPETINLVVEGKVKIDGRKVKIF